MKKLTTSVLAVVLTSSVSLAFAQKGRDTLRTQEIEAVVFVQPVTGKLKVQDEVTSSQQIIGSEQLNQASNPNAISALAGKASGVKINQTNSSVNASTSIQIRTPRTVTGSNEALVVIDNVPSSATVLSQLPPDVIESINIIKGAAGAALYGPQGVNGVVVVTTKSGSTNGRLKVTLNSAVDFETVAFLPERQREYGQGWDLHKINVENGAWGPAFNNPAYAGQYLPYGPSFIDVNGDGVIEVNPDDDELTPDDAGAIHSYYRPYGKDNVKDFFQVGSIFQNSLSVTTGTRDSYFVMNLGNLEREFVVMDDKLHRYSALLKGGAKVNNWKFEGQFNYIRQKSSVANSYLYHDLLQTASDVPITAFRDYPDRGYAWNVYYQNPYYKIKHDRTNSLSNYYNVIASASYNFNDHISLTYRGNMNFTSTEGSEFNDGWDEAIYDGAMNAIQSSYSESVQNRNNYYGDLLLNMNYDLTSALNMDLTLGHNYQDWRGKNFEAGGTGIIIPGLYQIWNLQSPTQPYLLDNENFHYNNHAIFANLDLDYNKYLFLNAVGRYEMSSKLRNDASNNKYSFFYPAVSASFVPTKAFDFGGNILNYMKITAAWQRVGGVSSLNQYDVYPTAVVGSGYPYSGVGGGQLSFVNNNSPTLPTINPEFITKSEIGLTLGFLRDRITFDGAVYKENTKDLITRQGASTASGIRSRLMNLGELEGKGLEFNLNLVPVKSDAIRWDLGFNYSTGYTEVVKLSDDAKEISILNYSYVGIYAVEGEKFPVIKGTTYLRDDQGRIIVDAQTGLPTVSSTMSVLGRATPKYIVGLNTSLRVKGFTLSATMDYRTGHKFYSGTLNSFTFSGQNVASAGFDRSQPYIIPNSSYLQGGAYVANTNVPIYATSTNNPNGSTYNPAGALESYFGGALYNQVGENFVLDASAFKIREIGLAYTFDKNVVENAGINELTIGVHARNPFVKFADENKNYDDPETGYNGGNAYSGFSSGSADQYPNVKSYGASVSVTF